MRSHNPVDQTALTEQTVLLNRHPIYYSKLNVIGYETQAHSGLGQVSDSQVDTPAVLKLLAENLDTLTGNHWGLVTLPQQAILDGDYNLLPRERVIIGIEEGPADEQLFKALAKLSKLGYRVALPFANENLRPLAGPADILMLNLAQVEGESLPARTNASSRQKAKLLVTGIETHEDFELCKELGCDFFQGYFFCTPKVTGKSVPVQRLAAVRLMAALQNREVRLQELEDIIRYDVSLSYKLLQFVNSAYMGLQRDVVSIKHAISMVGIERIRRWASLLLFASVGNKPRELMVTASIRARMCERLADSQNEDRQSTFFTVGLLSVLDALLDQPMAEALQGLSLSPEICEALVNRSGPLGTTLRAVVAYEQSDWKRHALLRFRPTKLQDSYLESLRWTHTVTGGLMI
ncbi:MAG TPA: HDOD domain-containing protein [Terriglobia bacterium]|nr:HDOD domain-containing protein [Terriglobia bacterium]